MPERGFVARNEGFFCTGRSNARGRVGPPCKAPPQRKVPSPNGILRGIRSRGGGSEIWRVRVRFDGGSAWTRAFLTHNRYRERGSSASAIHAPSVFRVEDGHIGGEAGASLGGGDAPITASRPASFDHARQGGGRAGAEEGGSAPAG